MTESAPFLSIIFPAHNEEERLPQTLEDSFSFIQSQPYSSEVVIVENGSNDRTFEQASTFCATHPDMRVIHLELPGKGRAVKAGMLAAKGSYRFICDVDLSMPINDIPRFIPPQMNGFDITIASREGNDAIRYNEPHYRHFVGRIFNNMVRWMVLPKLQDTQCGFKCFTAESAEKLFPRQTITGWTFDVEILAMAFKNGYRVQSIGIPWYYQPRSKVKVVRDSVRMFSDLVKIRRNLQLGVYDIPD